MSQDVETRWPLAQGSITRAEGWTIFRLVGLGGGMSVAIRSDRLTKVPGLYRRTLDLLARDVEVMQRGHL